MRLGLSLRRNGLIPPLLLVALASSACVRSPETKSAASIEAGKKLLEQKDAARAILQFRNATQATPRNPEAHYQLALAYLAAGDLQNGVASLRRALELNPQHGGAQFRLADLMSNASDPDVLQEAQKRLQALLHDSPQNAGALHALALTELKLGDSKGAEQHLEQAIAAAPQELVFAIALAEVKLRQKDTKTAESVLLKTTRDFPKSADALVILGRLYAKLNRAADSEEQFRRALLLDPNHGAAVFNLATLLYQTGRKQDAEPFFRRLSGFSDKALQPAYGNYLFQEGRRDEAVQECERLAKLDPDDRVARSRLVAVYQAVSRLADAQRVLGEALKRKANDLDALLQRGELSLDSGKFDEAEADLNKVVRLKPDSPEVHYVLAKLHQARGASLSQRQELGEALRLDPLRLQVRIELATQLIAGKASQAALDTLNQAPEEQKNLLPFIEQRNWAFLSLGRWAEARKGVDLGLASARTLDLLLQDAVLKFSGKHYTEARQSVREALAKSPEDLRALRILVASYGAENQTHKAIADVRAYAAQHSESAAVQYFLGTLLLQAGDQTQAKQALAAAKAANPDYTPADLSLAQIDLLQSNWGDARRELTAILSAKGENSQAHLWLGMVEASVGNQEAAIAHFRKVTEIQPNNALALNNLAYFLAESGHTDEALTYAQKAKELDPASADIEDTLGWVLYHKGVYPLAVKYLELADRKKSTAQGKFHLAMAYLKAGDKERGRVALNAATRLDPKLPEARRAEALFK